MTTNFRPLTTTINVRMGYNGIGVRLRAARITSGKTVQQIADGVDLDSSTIYKYENGRIDFPSPAKLFAIADYIDISEYWLLSGIGKPSSNNERNEAIRFCLESIETTTETNTKRRAYL